MFHQIEQWFDLLQGFGYLAGFIILFLESHCASTSFNIVCYFMCSCVWLL